MPSSRVSEAGALALSSNHLKTPKRAKGAQAKAPPPSLICTEVYKRCWFLKEGP